MVWTEFIYIKIGLTWREGGCFEHGNKLLGSIKFGAFLN
jgi:hypothetical protein